MVSRPVMYLLLGSMILQGVYQLFGKKRIQHLFQRMENRAEPRPLREPSQETRQAFAGEVHREDMSIRDMKRSMREVALKLGSSAPSDESDIIIGASQIEQGRQLYEEHFSHRNKPLSRRLEAEFQDFVRELQSFISSRNFVTCYRLFHEYVALLVGLGSDSLSDLEKKQMLGVIETLDERFIELYTNNQRRDLSRFFESQVIDRLRSITSHIIQAAMNDSVRVEFSTREGQNEMDENTGQWIDEHTEPLAEEQPIHPLTAPCPRCDGMMDLGRRWHEDTPIYVCHLCNYMEDVDTTAPVTVPKPKIIKDTLNISDLPLLSNIKLVKEGNCVVCRKPLKEGDDLSECPHCGVQGHYKHFHEWIRMKAKCPLCKHKIKVTRK